MRTKDHFHKFRRHTYKNKTQVYFCVNDCDYKVDVGMALGKKSLCNICGNEFIMNEYTIKLARPHCTACGKVKVTDLDGKDRFVNKARPTAAIAEMGKTAVSSLKERMSRVVTMEKDEDI